MSPEPGLAEQVARAQLARRAQRRVHVQHARGEPLEELRVLARDAEVAQRHLRVRVRRARRRARAPRDRGTSARARGRRRGRSTTPVANETRTEPPARIRTRWRRLTIGSSTAPVEPLSGRPSSAMGSSTSRPRPRKRARSRLPLHGTLQAALDAQHVDAVERRVGAAPRPAVGHERVALRQIARGHEQLAERRVREVVRGQAEHQLGVARDLDLARPRAAVREREAAHLDVVLRRHRDLEQRLDAVGLAVEGGLLGQEARDVVVELLARRVVRGRPDGTAPTSRR